MPTYWRRIVREKVLQALYAHELSKEPITLVAEYVLDSLRKHKADFEFAKKLLYSVIQHQAELDVLIRSKSSNWQFDRIAVIDVLLLRMGICELIYFSDIPPKVTINEAIEIAKAYSTEKSGQFVNGILDAVYEDLQSSGRLSKSGRGLIEDTEAASRLKPNK
jgi:N utilization substance protein B